ncbi:transketolase-like TK C-terminal-containing protein [Mycoplasmopsis cricetuli]|uniref:transketolase-like TK C-terminal-containing protein n=1 Tax=Mycoplasmopsis cricetuli TaxID=171283 RepID=UPI0004712AE6|nr:transketolase [Mycoplasmopsis cricetuli]
MKDKNIEVEFINATRAMALDGINNAKQGHIGMALGANEIFYSIIKSMNFNEKNPKWINRDRFVLSAGHGSMGLYSLYHFMGLLTKQDIIDHKQFNSKTPSHPEIDKLNLIDASTGPLGQGVAMAVGMAKSEQFLAQKFNKNNFNLIDHHIFALCGDGDLQEGVALEAIQFAGTNKLNKLILIHDYNNVQIDSYADQVNNIDFEEYFIAQKFNVQILKNNKVATIIDAIKRAQQSSKPSYIQVPTKIAFKTKYENQSMGHNGILSESETIEYKQKLKLIDFEPFKYDSKYYHFGSRILKSKNISYSRWIKKLEQYKIEHPDLFTKLNDLINNKITFSLKNLEIKQTNQATRNYAHEIMQHLDKNHEFLMGGSADLRAATKVGFNDNKNIQYGIREFAMAAINNGIYLHSNIKTFASTFLVFADYAKAALRLGALMQIPNIYIFSHDSYSVGGDGPTHQPVEQLTMLRSIPNFEVLRVADENEAKNAFEYALNSINKPTAIILCRQSINSFKKQNKFSSAYFIKKYQEFDITLLASGSEVELAYKTSEMLKKQNIKANVISVLSLQGLLADEFLVETLGINKKPIFAIEASNDSMWYQLSKFNAFDCHLAKEFGHSAPGDFVYAHNGFSAENITYKVMKFLSKIHN